MSGQLGAPLKLGGGRGRGLRLCRGRGRRQLLPRHRSQPSTAASCRPTWTWPTAGASAFGGMAYRVRRLCADAGLEPADPGADRQRDLCHRPRHHPGGPRRQRPADPQRDRAGGLIPAISASRPATDPRFTLDTGVGTTTLDRRTVFISDRGLLRHRHPDRLCRPARTSRRRRDVEAAAVLRRLEPALRLLRLPRRLRRPGRRGARQLDDAVRRLGAVHGQAIAGASLPRAIGGDRQGELQRRRHLARPARPQPTAPTATDIFDDPFSAEPGDIGLTWETDVRSRWRDAGLFGSADLSLGQLEPDRWAAATTTTASPPATTGRWSSAPTPGAGTTAPARATGPTAPA